MIQNDIEFRNSELSTQQNSYFISQTLEKELAQKIQLQKRSLIQQVLISKQHMSFSLQTFQDSIPQEIQKLSVREFLDRCQPTPPQQTLSPPPVRDLVNLNQMHNENDENANSFLNSNQLYQDKQTYFSPTKNNESNMGRPLFNDINIDSYQKFNYKQQGLQRQREQFEDKVRTPFSNIANVNLKSNFKQNSQNLNYNPALTNFATTSTLSNRKIFNFNSNCKKYEKLSDRKERTPWKI